MMSTELKKKIGFFGLTMIAVGSCIGSGIFIAPSDIAGHLGDATLILAIWALGGLVTMTGSLTFAELGGRHPDAGGVYVFIKKAFGNLTAFLYGWVTLTVITSGALAAISLTCARFLSEFFPMTQMGMNIFGATAIAAVTAVNLMGIKFSEILTNVFTMLKLLGIAVILIGGVMVGAAVEGPEIIRETTSSPGMQGIALGMIGVMWSMGGWHHASYLSAEVKNAKRVVPRAMILGALIVTLTYILINWAYLRMLSVEEAANSSAIAAEALGNVFPFGSAFVTALIVISTFGSIAIFTFSAPRIYYNLAKDGGFFSAISRVHPRTGVPVNAILLQSGWAIVILFFWQRFEQVMASVVFMDIIFMVVAAVGLFVLRRKYKEYQGFRVPWFPIVPLFYIITMTIFIGYMIVGRPEQALWGAGLMVLGLPVYYWSKSRSRQS